jgi:NitT/TauT family transport system substrate-binding protein
MTTGRSGLVLACLLAGLLLAWGCRGREEAKPGGAPLALTLAVTPSVYSGLIPIAADQGFFRDAGLEVAIRRYPSGLAALRAVTAGEAQAGTVADFAFAGEIDDDPSLRIVASIGLSNTNEIVARRDRGIKEPADLRGKRIGVSRGTTGEYYLDAFLLAHAISPDEVTRVEVPPARTVEAIETGEVDAVSTWDVYVYEAKRRLGDNAASWPAQNNQNYHWLLAAREGSIRTSPEAMRRLLGALVRAERFVLGHDAEARDIVARWGEFEPEFIRQAWSGSRLAVSLGQSLVTSLDACLRWRMRRDGSAAEPPNVLDYMYVKALEQADPRAVTLLR